MKTLMKNPMNFDDSSVYDSDEKAFMQESSIFMDSMAKYQPTVPTSRVAECFGELETKSKP